MSDKNDNPLRIMRSPAPQTANPYAATVVGPPPSEEETLVGPHPAQASYVIGPELEQPGAVTVVDAFFTQQDEGLDAPEKYLTVCPPESVPGRRVGNVEITEKVGTGSMGTVFKAVHRTLKTPYAVKILHARYSMDDNATERFRREALVCSQLQHPNVVFVTDFGRQRDLGIYIIMEYLDGKTLKQRLEEGPLGIDEACRLTLQICAALGAAHRVGITHRDMKPDNVIILENEGQEPFVKVLDFGIASVKIRQMNTLTANGMVMGTPAYMAPEQIQGLKKLHGPCTDIYSLGVMLYEMLTGKRPFRAKSAIMLCRKHLLDPPRPPSALRPELKGTPLEAIVLKMLAKRPENRPASTAEISQVLQNTLAKSQAAPAEHKLARPPAFATDQISAKKNPRVKARYDFIRTCLQLAPKSEVSALIRAVPQVADTRDDQLFLLMWGALCRDLLDHALEDPRFEVATALLERFVGLVLDSKDLDLRRRNRMLRSVLDLMNTCGRGRQQRLVTALQPLTTRPDFPVAVLPTWARASATGTWRPLPRPNKPAAGRGKSLRSKPPQGDH